MNRPTYLPFCSASLVNCLVLKKTTTIRWNLRLIADSSNEDIIVGSDKITHLNEPIAIAMRTTGRKSGERMIAAVENDGRSGWWSSWETPDKFFKSESERNELCWENLKAGNHPFTEMGICARSMVSCRAEPKEVVKQNIIGRGWWFRYRRISHH